MIRISIPRICTFFILLLCVSSLQADNNTQVPVEGGNITHPAPVQNITNGSSQNTTTTGAGGAAIQASANATSTQAPNSSIVSNSTSPVKDVPVSGVTATDQQFLFLMNQYWIPDMYEIKGRIDGSLGYYSEFPELLNMSEEYAEIRLTKNINETMAYNLSDKGEKIRKEYQNAAREGLKTVERVRSMNQSSPQFINNATTQVASFSLYGSWMEYQIMKMYNLPNMTYPDIASVSSDQFMSVMNTITT